MNALTISENSRKSSKLERNAWPIVLLCLIVLVGSLALTLLLPELSGPSTLLERIKSARQPVSAIADDAIHSWASPNQSYPNLLCQIASPLVDTEIPDIDPVMLIYKKLSIQTTALLKSTNQNKGILRCFSVPLYLTHKSLLC